MFDFKGRAAARTNRVVIIQSSRAWLLELPSLDQYPAFSNALKRVIPECTCSLADWVTILLGYDADSLPSTWAMSVGITRWKRSFLAALILRDEPKGFVSFSDDTFDSVLHWCSITDSNQIRACTLHNGITESPGLSISHPEYPVCISFDDGMPSLLSVSHRFSHWCSVLSIPSTSLPTNVPSRPKSNTSRESDAGVSSIKSLNDGHDAPTSNSTTSNSTTKSSRRRKHRHGHSQKSKDREIEEVAEQFAFGKSERPKSSDLSPKSENSADTKPEKQHTQQKMKSSMDSSSGWKEAITEDGKVYYYHKVSNCGTTESIVVV